MQRAYLDGLEAEGVISLKGTGEEGFPSTAEGGPTVRKGVDAGTDVIDLTAMRKHLESTRGGA